MIRIYADFNERDCQGRPVLEIPGSRRDMLQHKDKLGPGVRVILYQPAELEVEATLVFDNGWVAEPDWQTVKYYNPSKESSPD